MTDEKTRPSIALGEIIALAALIVSALGVWIAWKSSSKDEPTRIVEQKSAVPLALRGSVSSNGETLTIAPADPSHAIESLVVRIKGTPPIEAGSDGRLSARDVEQALNTRDKEAKDATLTIPVTIEARYVESGADRRGGGNYLLRYKWVGGGLFGGRSLRLVGLRR